MRVMIGFPYARMITCSAVTGAAACTLDLHEALTSPGVLAIGALLGAALGAFGAACLCALLGISGRLPRGWPAATWIAVGGLVCVALNQRLGMSWRLFGPERTLARIALVASLCGGTGFGLLGLSLQPFAHAPRGFVLQSGLGLRRFSVAVWLAVAFGCLWIDRDAQVSTYPAVHLALTTMALSATSVALLIIADMHWLTLRVGVRRVAAGCVLGIGLWGALAMVRESNEPTGLWHVLLSRPFSAASLRAARTLSDFDRDGYGAFFGGGDCAPLNASVHPDAAERPDNGIDDNCSLGDARGGSDSQNQPPPPPVGAPRSSVVLITIDALSAGHVSAYGYAARTTPQLDQWAENALRFDRAYTTGGWTTIALSSLFRGRYARALRWTRLNETSEYRLLRTRDLKSLHPGEHASNAFGLPLDDDHPTLGALLSKAGYATVALVDDGYTQVLDAEVGGFSGFGRYENVRTVNRKRATDADVSRVAMQTLKELRTGPPFFLWVHYFGPHLPNRVHRGTRRFRTGPSASYDHEVAYMDSQLGLLLAAIEHESTQRSIAVIVTSDHGEVIHSNWRGHGLDVTDASLRVPLFVRAKGLGAGHTLAPASLVDIMPTVLDLTATPRPAGLDGVNLLSLSKDPTRRVVFSDTWRQDLDGTFIIDLVAAQDGQTKLVRNRLDADEYMVEQTDSSETDQVVGRSAPRLRAALARYLEKYGPVRVGD